MKVEPGDILSIKHKDEDRLALVCRVDGRKAQIAWIMWPHEIYGVLTDGEYVAGLGWCEVRNLGKLGHCDPGE